jgi:cell division protein FtsZ
MSDTTDAALNVRVPSDLLDQIDGVSETRGFTSRSEFVRMVLRDAVNADRDVNPEAVAEATVSDDEEALSLDEARRDVERRQLVDEAQETFEDSPEHIRRSIVSDPDELGAIDTVVESALGTREDTEDDGLDIRVVGCGAAGVRIVSEIYSAETGLCQTGIVDTDLEELNNGKADNRAIIGKRQFEGNGSHGDVEAVSDAADRAESIIRELVGEPDLVFVVTGLGGGTGTAVAPKLAERAQETGAVTVSIATLPFGFDQSRVQHSRDGLVSLDAHSDTLAVLDGNRIAADPTISMSETLPRMNQNIAHVVTQLCRNLGQFYVSDETDTVLSKLRNGGRSVLMESEIDLAADESYDELSDRLLQYTNIDVRDEDPTQAILMFTAGSAVHNASDEIDDIVASIRNNTDDVAWASHQLFRADDVDGTVLRVAGLLTGISVDLTEFFESEEMPAESTTESPPEESDAGILPGTEKAAVSAA